MRMCLVLALLVLVHSSLFSQTLLFEERFTAGRTQNEWRPGFNGNSMEVESLSGNPSGDGWVGKLGNHFSGGNVGATHSVAQFTDFFFEAKVYIPVDAGVYHGIEFRVDTTGLSAGYQFVARFQPGGMITPRLRFRQRPTDNPGMPAVIRDWEASEIPGGIPATSGWHTLGVRAQGHRFWFYFDGALLPGSPILDFTFLSGSIGAYLWDSSSPMLALFVDDLLVYSDIPTAISEDDAAVLSPRLHAPYPQPVRDRGSIRFELPDAGQVSIDLHDLLGRRVARLADGAYPAGMHTVALPAGDLPPGMYLLRMTSGPSQLLRRVQLLR